MLSPQQAVWDMRLYTIICDNNPQWLAPTPAESPLSKYQPYGTSWPSLMVSSEPAAGGNAGVVHYPESPLMHIPRWKQIPGSWTWCANSRRHVRGYLLMISINIPVCPPAVWPQRLQALLFAKVNVLLNGFMFTPFEHMEIGDFESFIYSFIESTPESLWNYLGITGCSNSTWNHEFLSESHVTETATLVV